MNNSKCYYKAFDRKEYAVNFIEKGEMRFGSLEYYKNIEDDTRRDETEGCCQFIFPGNRTIESDGSERSDYNKEDGFTCVCMEASTACFAFCVSDHAVDLENLREKGEFIVKINSPEKLLEEIEICCKTNTSEWPYREYFLVLLQRVKYTKGNNAGRDISDMMLFALTTCQKHSDFSLERECRYLLDSNISKEHITADHIMLDLGKKLDFCELIEF